MAINPIDHKGSQPVTGKENEGKTRVQDLVRQNKDMANQQILKASEQVALGSKNEPLALLYRSAIEEINTILEPALGEGAIQAAAANPGDWTPTATANRIVSFATGFWGAYRDKNSGGELESTLGSFMDTIRGAIDKGFGEAKDILEGLKVFQGVVEENANETYELIQEGLDRFEQAIMGDDDAEQETPSES